MVTPAQHTHAPDAANCAAEQATPSLTLTSSTPQPGPARYAVAVGQRFLTASGRLVREQTLLTSDEAIAALLAGGFELAMLVPEEHLPPEGVALHMRRACAIVLAEPDPDAPTEAK